MKFKTAVIVLLVCTIMYSQDWIRIEGTSLESYSVEINPHNKNTILFGHSNGEIFVSYNGGYSADDTIIIPPDWGMIYPITSVFMHPSDTNLIFASTFQGSFKSTDYGTTWNTYLPEYTIGFNGESVTCDPLHPDTMYVGVAGNQMNRDLTFFRSYDRGMTWESINMNGHRFCSVTALEDGSVLGGNYDAGLLLRSTDNGTTWVGVYSTPDTAQFEIPKITQDPNNPGIVWAVVLSFSGSDGYIIKSEDYGKTWAEIWTMGNEVNPWAIDIDKRGRIIVGMFAGGERGAYISYDNGNNWNIYSSGIPANQDPLVWMVKSNNDSLGVFICDSRLGAYKLNNTVVSVKNDDAIINSFTLYQNFPNPFNPSTTIRFNLPSEGLVQLNVYNTLGEEIAVLLNKEMDAGTHEINYNAANLPGGIYFYRMRFKENYLTYSFVLLK